MSVKIRDVQPGTVLNLDPEADYVTEANKVSIENGMTVVDSVNGGWADNMAGPGEVVVYSSGNLVEPIIMRADQLVESVTEAAKKRLEYLRGEINADRISWGEIAELESLAEWIDPGDVQLLEWAGVTEDL